MKETRNMKTSRCVVMKRVINIIESMQMRSAGNKYTYDFEPDEKEKCRSIGKQLLLGSI